MKDTDDAICLRCGHGKPFPWSACDSCHFEPAEDEDQVKSMYLSVERFEQDNASGREAYREEMEKLGTEIRNGRPIEFDNAELARLREEWQLVKAFLTPRDTVAYLFQLFAPGLAIIAGLLILFLIMHFVVP